LAGALEVIAVDHRFLSGIAGTNGFDGIAVAFLGGSGGVGIAAAALLFGGLMSGARYLQLQTSVPSAIAVVLQAILIVGAAARWPTIRARMGRPSVPVAPSEAG
jgi:simple sugar transport system permease protein